MGQYNFTYEVPENFHEMLVHHLQQNGNANIAPIVQRCSIDYEDVGLAYYAGLKGDNWDKKALDFTIEGSESNVNQLKSNDKLLKEVIHKLLRPSKTGFLIRNIDYLIATDDFEIKLPEEQGESFEILSADIYDALGRDEPTLVLDRLHTYSSKYLRDICDKHGISTADDSGNNYPLHSLAGSLAKYYDANNVFESDFVQQTLKMSISTFERYNSIRNNKSYAHDNDVLNKAEATYVVTIITATLTLIHKIENQ
jgi:hypothetical protein